MFTRASAEIFSEGTNYFRGKFEIDGTGSNEDAEKLELLKCQYFNMFELFKVTLIVS